MASAADSGDLLRAATQALADGDPARAAQLAGERLALAPGDPAARSLRVNALLRLERWDDAVGDLETLITAQPRNAQLRRLLALCWLRIGNRQRGANADAAAIDAYRRAIAAAPQLQDARHNLGVLLLARGRAADALPLLRVVADAEPHNALAGLDLARAELATGASERAIARATALAGSGAAADILEACATLLIDAGAAGAAAPCLRRMAGMPGRNVEWLLAQARRLRDNAAPEASDELLGALALAPLSAPERLCVDMHAALGLPAVYPSVAAIEERRARFSAGLERLVADYPAERIAAMAPPPDLLRWDNFLLAYQGHNDRALQQRFGAWYAAALQAVVPIAPPRRRATPRTRPRIALVSGRWHYCTVGVYFAAWIEALATRGWEVALVHAGAYRDQWTERLARAAAGELTLTGPLAESARRIRELDADLVLYPELGMDATVLALAALPLAPLQAGAWGHPSTTGLPKIDAFLSCAGMEPADGAAHYSERLLLLPGLGTRYPAPEAPPPAPRAELGLPDGRMLYLVPQSPFKLHPDNDDVLARIAAADDDAAFVMFAARAPGATRRLRERLVARLGQRVSQPERRVILLDHCERGDYLRVNRACDVMVDSLHWSGGNTTLDALHSALPVVTCPGDLMRGRQSAAMLRALGQDELVVDSPQRLADAAVALARDPARRSSTGAALRESLPTLTASETPLDRLDQLLRGLLAEDGA